MEGDEKSEAPAMLVRVLQVSPCMLGLPEHLVREILEWSRPDDENQCIWIWLCRVSGTCRLFRRLVRPVVTEMQDGTTVSRLLLPTVFELKENYYYLNEDPPEDFPPFGPVSFRVNLMETIRNSDWMASSITNFSARRFETRGLNRGADPDIIDGIKMLVTAPSMPNLENLHIDFPLVNGQYPVDEDFLLGIAQSHPGLLTLTLPEIDMFRISSDTLATFASSMSQLQEANIQVVGRYFSLGFLRGHMTAFVSNLNPSLTSLALYFQCDLQRDLPADTILECLQDYLPNLKSLTLHAKKTTLRLADIIRSKRHLSYLDVFSTRGENDHGLITAILEMQLPLETFRVTRCKWINNAGIMRLLRGQIAAGNITLETLGICKTSVTPNGLREFLMEWSEWNSGRRLTVEVLALFGVREEEENRQWQQLAREFPNVEIK